MGTLNTLLANARNRLSAGDQAGALAAIDAFLKAVNNPARRNMIGETTIAVLTASAEYLLRHPAP
jgi:hypothetical protein